jgi:hypothetical protein
MDKLKEIKAKAREWLNNLATWEELDSLCRESRAQVQLRRSRNETGDSPLLGCTY